MFGITSFSATRPQTIHPLAGMSKKELDQLFAEVMQDIKDGVVPLKTDVRRYALYSQVLESIAQQTAQSQKMFLINQEWQTKSPLARVCQKRWGQLVEEVSQGVMDGVVPLKADFRRYALYSEIMRSVEHQTVNSEKILRINQEWQRRMAQRKDEVSETSSSVNRPKV